MLGTNWDMTIFRNIMGKPFEKKKEKLSNFFVTICKPRINEGQTHSDNQVCLSSNSLSFSLFPLCKFLHYFIVQVYTNVSKKRDVLHVNCLTIFKKINLAVQLKPVNYFTYYLHTHILQRFKKGFTKSVAKLNSHREYFGIASET